MSSENDDTLLDRRRPGQESTLTSAPDRARHDAQPTDAPPDHPTLPTIDTSNYVLGPEIAAGGMGRIVLSRDLRLGRTVAIKELLFQREELDYRFEREARITARLQHPSIVSIYEAGRWPTGEPFYAMRLIEGRPLKQVVANATTLVERLALLPSVIAATEALAYAHSQHVIHRDLKPTNIIVGDFGETVVIDWGLAKDLAATREDSHGGNTPLPGELTDAGTVMGTPSFMPPEQAAGRRVDERADVYSLGAILYFVLSGCSPFAGHSSDTVLAHVVVDAPIPLADRQPGIEEDLLAIVAKAMARDPEGRYRTALEFAQELRRFQTGQLVGAYRYSTLDLVRRFVRRHRVPVGTALLALLLLAAISIVSLRRIVDEKRIATSRADELTLMQARVLLRTDPALALAWLKGLSSRAEPWRTARVLAADARARGLPKPLVTSSVVAFALSTAGKELATVHGDGTVKIWSLLAGSGRTIGRLEGSGRVVAFTARGVVAGGGDHAVRLFGPGGARLLYTHSATVVWLGVSADGTVIATRDGNGETKLWDLAADTGRTMGEAVPSATLAALSADGRWLASAGSFAAIRLFDLRGGAERTLIGHEASLSALAFSPDGTWLASGSDDRTLRLWRTATGESRILAGHEGGVGVVAFSPDGASLASGSPDRTVRVWSVATSEVRTLHGHQGDVVSLAFSPRGDRLFSASLDATVRQWNLATGDSRSFPMSDKAGWLAVTADGSTLAIETVAASVFLLDLSHEETRTILTHEGPAWSVAVSADGREVTSVGADDTLRISGLEGQARTLHAPSSDAQLGFVALSPDGRSATTISSNKAVRLWNLATGQQQLLPGHATLSLAMASDGAVMAAAGADEPVAYVWTPAGETRTLRGHTGWVTSVALSPDGSALATSSEDSTVRLWDLATGASRVLEGHEGPATRVAFSPDGRQLASAGERGHVRLWNVATGNAEADLLGHEGSIQALAFLPTGEQLASGGMDHTLRLWKLADRSATALVGHTAPITAIEVAPSGQALASLDQDGGVIRWDLQSGEGRALIDDGGPVTSIAIAPDGTTLACAHRDGTVRLWTDDVPEEPLRLRSWLDQATPRTIGR